MEGEVNGGQPTGQRRSGNSLGNIIPNTVQGYTALHRVQKDYP